VLVLVMVLVLVRAIQDSEEGSCRPVWK